MTTHEFVERLANDMMGGGTLDRINSNLAFIRGRVYYLNLLRLGFFAHLSL